MTAMIMIMCSDEGNKNVINDDRSRNGAQLSLQKWVKLIFQFIYKIGDQNILDFFFLIVG